MKFTIIALSIAIGLMANSSAFGRNAHTHRNTAVSQPAAVQGSTERQRYRPCPANVVMANGRHVCLG